MSNNLCLGKCGFYGTVQLQGYCSKCSKYKPIDSIFELEKHSYHYNNQILREVQIFDQWSQKFKPLIEKYQTPSAICGYLSITIAYFLSELQTSNLKEINEAILHISSSKDFLERLENVMKFIQTDRKNYTQEYSKEFSSESEISSYISDWVANYEISDFLKKYQNPRIHFVRGIERNLDGIKHEEKRRVDEEIPFRNEKFFIEVSENGVLKSPLDWKKEKYQNCILIIDLGGHFGVGTPFEKSICLINTLESKYVDRKIMELIQDVLYD